MLFKKMQKVEAKLELDVKATENLPRRTEISSNPIRSVALALILDELTHFWQNEFAAFVNESRDALYCENTYLLPQPLESKVEKGSAGMSQKRVYSEFNQSQENP